MKRWFAIGLLAAGVLAIGYVGFSMRRAKKASDASDAPNVTPNGPAPPAA